MKKGPYKNRLTDYEPEYLSVPHGTHVFAEIKGNEYSGTWSNTGFAITICSPPPT